MPVNIPPITGNQEVDQFNYDVAQELNNLGATGGADVEVTRDNQDRPTIDDIVLGYPLRFLEVAYGTDGNGANFSETIRGLPTGSTEIWQGVRNQATDARTTNPASFTWREITHAANSGTLRAFYRNLGGRQIEWVFNTAAQTPSGFTEDTTGNPIDLDALPGAPGVRGPEGPVGIPGVSTLAAFDNRRSSAAEVAAEEGRYNLLTTAQMPVASAWSEVGTIQINDNAATDIVRGLIVPDETHIRIFYDADNWGYFTITNTPTRIQNNTVTSYTVTLLQSRGVITAALDSDVPVSIGWDTAAGARGEAAINVNLVLDRTVVSQNADRTYPATSITATVNWQAGGTTTISRTVGTIDVGSDGAATFTQAMGATATVNLNGVDYTPAYTFTASTRTLTVTTNGISDSASIFLGSIGTETATVNLYQRTATAVAPALPTGDVEYTFSTGTVDTDNLNGWTQDIPASSTNSNVWLITRFVSSATSDTVDIAPADWSTPTSIAITAPDVQNWIFIDVPAAATVTAPAASPGTPTTPFTFMDASYLWSDAPPVNPVGVIWASLGTQGGGSGNFSWETPQRLTGQTGTSSRVDIAYATNLPAQQSYNISGSRSNVEAGGTSTVPRGSVQITLPTNATSGTSVDPLYGIRMDLDFNSGTESRTIDINLNSTFVSSNPGGTVTATNSRIQQPLAASSNAVQALTRISTLITAQHSGITFTTPTRVEGTRPSATIDLTGLSYPLPSAFTSFTLRWDTYAGIPTTGTSLSVIIGSTGITSAENLATVMASSISRRAGFTASASNGVVTVSSTLNIVLEEELTFSNGVPAVSISGQRGVFGYQESVMNYNQFPLYVPSIRLFGSSDRNPLTVTINTNRAGSRPAIWQFDPDVDNALYSVGVNIPVRAFEVNQTATQMLTDIGTRVAALDSGITWNAMVSTSGSNSSIIVQLTSGNTILRPDLVVSQNSGTNVMPTIQSGAQSNYRVVDYANREVINFSSSVAVASASDRDFVINRIVDAIDDNIETPIDFRAERVGSRIVLDGQTTGVVSNRWSVVVNHGTGNGNLLVGGVTTSTIMLSPTWNLVAPSIFNGAISWGSSATTPGDISFIPDWAGAVGTFLFLGPTSTGQQITQSPTELRLTVAGAVDAATLTVSRVADHQGAPVFEVTAVANTAGAPPTLSSHFSGAITLAYSTMVDTGDGLAVIDRIGSTTFSDTSFPNGRLTDNSYTAASAQGHNFIGERLVTWSGDEAEPAVSVDVDDYAFTALRLS